MSKLALFSIVLLLHSLSLHWQSLESHARLIEQVIVRVSIEDDLLILSAVSHKVDVHAILLEEICRLKALDLLE